MAGTKTATFIHDGDAIDYTPTEDVVSKQIVVINDMIGVAYGPIAADKKGSLRTKGVYDFPQDTGVIAAGTDIFWDESQGVATTDDDSGVNLWLGKSVPPAAVSGDTTVRVMLEYCPDHDYTGAHTPST